MSNLFTHAITYLIAVGSAGIIVIGRAIQTVVHEHALNKAAKQEIERARIQAEAAPENTTPAWDLARAKLEAYFNRNLTEIRSIFWLSVAVMLVGFAIVGFGIYLATIQQQKTAITPASISPASIATISGIITQFIGATFLFMYRSTIQQAINYSRTLERINSVGMAMQILDTMPDATTPEDLKSKTKALLVDLLVRQVYIPA